MKRLVAVWMCAVLSLCGIVPLLDTDNRAGTDNISIDDESIPWDSLIEKYFSDETGEVGLGSPDDPTGLIGPQGATRGILDPAWGNETTNTAVCTAALGQNGPQLVPDGQGGAIIAWHDLRSGNYDIYAQRLSAGGLPVWTADGVAVCTASGSQNGLQLVPDGQGGAIITWRDYRSGTNYDIYAQRVSMSGAVQWSVGGVAVCTASGSQDSPQLVPNGQGGAIITWQDMRSGNYDIYAQRLSASGAAQWTADGIAICTASGSQSNPQPVPDGQGGAIITWQDYRSGNDDIYAQRLSTNGAAQWTADGVAVCTASGDQYTPRLVPDGQGGAIITWMDSRSGNADIYAQRLSIYAARLWTWNGVAVCVASGNQSYPQPVPDGQGGAIITWYDSRSIGNSDIYAQRLSASGAAQWTADGASVCVASGSQYTPRLVPDGQGGTIIVWSDYRSGNYDIYAQRFNINGIPLWERNGLALCTAPGTQVYPQITIDNRWLSGNQQAQSPEQSNTANEAKGIIVVWQDDRNLATSGTDIYAQAISEDCKEFVERHAPDPLWGNETTNTPVCSMAIGSQSYPQLVPDGQGGAIITWHDSRSGNADIYAQRLSASGAAQWTADGVAVCTASGDQWYPQLVLDGQGGAIITWYDYRSGTADIYAQRLRASGTAMWGGDGLAVCTAIGDQYFPRLVPDGQGGAIITWQDYRSGNDDIYAQRLSMSGAVQWSVGGVAVCTASGDQYTPRLVPDGQGGAIITWRDYRSGNYDIYAQRLNIYGARVWTADGVAVCTASMSQESPQLIPDGQSGALITWMDYRSGTADIYAQRLSASGLLYFVADGVAVCTASDSQYDPQPVPDGQGGTIITWSDYRSGTDGDIYAQRLSATGAAQWAADGVAVCTASGSQNGLQLVPDGQGGAIITWRDYRSGTDGDIYAQRLSASGGAQWTADGAAVCVASGTQYSPRLVPDGQGGTIIVWYDYRSGNYDIYAQRISLTQSTVVINEVMHAPASGNEWVELHNPSQVNYNISGWTLVDNMGAAFFTVPPSTALAPGAYFICDIASPSLDNDDWVALYDSDGIMRDYVCWGISEPFGSTHDRAVLAQHWTEGAGFYIDTFAHIPGMSIGRDMDSNDSNSKLDWEITGGADTTTPTPGAMNFDYEFDIPVVAGWNLISIPLVPFDTSVEGTLSSIGGSWDVVKTYDGITKTWKTYRVGSTMNTLFNIDCTMGVWLHALENCTLTVNGGIPASASIMLYAGWNLVGYPSMTEKMVGLALWGTQADMVDVFQQETPYIREAEPEYIMKPGDGLWVRVPADTVWVVDW